MSGKRTKALRREFRAEHGRAPVTRLRNNGTCVVGNEFRAYKRRRADDKR